MSVFTNPLVKRINDAMDNPQTLADHLLVVGARQVAALSFNGIGRVIPGVDRLTEQMLEDAATRLEQENMQTLTPWSR